MYHLMDNGISDPRALLARGAVDESIVGTELNGAHTGTENIIQLLVIARESGARLPRIHVFPDSKMLDRHRSLTAVDEDVGIAEAIRIEELKAVIFAARRISRPRVLSNCPCRA